MNVLNDIATGAVISQVLSFLMKLLPRASNRVKIILTVVICLIGGTVNYIVDNGGTLDKAFHKDGVHWALTIVAVLGSAWAYHEKVLQPWAKDKKPDYATSRTEAEERMLTDYRNNRPSLEE
jgi:hypothetical protein